MTFRKSKLIDNRLSWHPLGLCAKFGSQGDRIGTENLFQPSKQTGWFDVILVKRILRAKVASSPFLGPSLARSCEAHFAGPDRRAFSQAKE